MLNLPTTGQIEVRKFLIYQCVHRKECHLFTELFRKVVKRDEHVQNMKKFEDVFDLHRGVFKQRRTLSKAKVIIEQGGQTCQTFAKHES